MREIETNVGPARVHVFAPSGSQSARGTVLLGHGAGGGVESADLQALAELSQHGWCVVLIEQPWRVAGRRIAVAPAKLDEAASDILDALSGDPHPLPRPWVLGGRSAGARVACRLADRAQALVLIAFPLQPPGPRSRGGLAPSRIGELLLPVRRGIPVLVLQGVRDRFGGPEEILSALATAGEPTEEHDGAAAPVSVRPYPGDHAPSRDPEPLVADTLAFLNALP